MVGGQRDRVMGLGEGEQGQRGVEVLRGWGGSEPSVFSPFTKYEGALHSSSLLE